MQTVPIITKEIDIMAQYLTPTEQDILDSINAFYERNGVLPTNKELMEEYSQQRVKKGIKNPNIGKSFISQYLVRLADKGHILYVDGTIKQVNIQSVLNVDYVFRKLEWLSEEFKSGRLTEEEYRRYKKLLNERL